MTSPVLDVGVKGKIRKQFLLQTLLHNIIGKYFTVLLEWLV